MLTGLFFLLSKTTERPGFGCVWLCFPCYCLPSSLCLALEIMISSIRMCCSVKSRALLWMHECVSAFFVEETEPVCSRQHHTCWVTLLHCVHNFMEHREKKEKTNTSGSVGGHPLSVRELHVKWNIIFNNSVLISLFDWNSCVCVCVCLVTSLLLWPSCSCCAKQERLCSKPVTTG